MLQNTTDEDARSMMIMVVTLFINLLFEQLTGNARFNPNLFNIPDKEPINGIIRKL
jgi:hypothetical protein